MTPTDRILHEGAARHTLGFDGVTLEIDYRWHQRVDDALAERIVELMRHTSAAAPIIGFAEEISDEAAAGYIADLRANLDARKCRLLVITTAAGLLVGLCTLRRNLNPNNGHIADLAKGMIRDTHRGGLVLPAAFHEIALQCEADGVEVVTLDVRAGTPAHKAWERFGFQTWGVMPDYARAQGTVHAGHFMMQRVADLKARALAALGARRERAPAGEGAAAATATATA
jgi:hypothetical protein